MSHYRRMVGALELQRSRPARQEVRSLFRPGKPSTASKAPGSRFIPPPRHPARCGCGSWRSKIWMPYPRRTSRMDVPPKRTLNPIETTGFRLVFHASLPHPLPQDTYRFEHPTLGKFSLFHRSQGKPAGSIRGHHQSLGIRSVI